MQYKLNSLLLTTTLAIAIAFSSSVRAEYYLASSSDEPCMNCNNTSYSCTKKKYYSVKKYKHHRIHHTCRVYHQPKRHSSVSISVYYYCANVPPCYQSCNTCGGCCNCADGYARQNSCTSRGHSFVGFSGEPTSWGNTYNDDFEDYRSWDRTTQDDDPYFNPDMDIDN